MKKDRNFIKGFLLGASAIILMTAILIITVMTVDTGNTGGQNGNFYNLFRNKGSNNDSEQSSVVDSDSVSTSDSNKETDKKIKKIKNFIEKYYLEDVNEDDYALGLYKGLVASLGDPYSTYYTEKEYEDMITSSSGKYFGIGVTVSQNPSTGIITVVKPFVTGPGYEAGLLPGDIIYMVEGEEVTGLDLSEVVTRIKGPAKTKVKISIVRENVSEAIDFTIERRQIEVPTIEYEMLKDNVGYIQVTEFDEVTLDQYINAVKDLDKKGMKGLVVDLRDNPGGLLDVVVDMLDYMLPEGMIVYTEDKYGNRDEYKSSKKNMFKKPLAILINGNSASASEIFAGAIQDYGIGTIVGKTTFGKGIVQRLFTLGDGTALKLTISKYYTPKGNDIHMIGIKPDIEVDLDDELKKQVVIDKEKDNQLQRAIEVIKEENR